MSNKIILQKVYTVTFFLAVYGYYINPKMTEF